ncbi:E3 SUMO-protein ligase pli1 [Elasticomyces elasticus]|uniref:E3 SUMO-protein ligase pli1 n=1 Tax=Exophiala sideris TaxID=1016849 RepID=A0ABR0JL51_9EURO|nr:E3 SUMO-protein ligase pli1 [Elasticomyces elasticus]KAK5036318.1 E3 SUMO-protein ligase pli1 [Exophiala sideris]KAK5066701.1 E3 SUMO-protein ligase pli1 [Exophiala sideris]KAK5184759.1 E3 SUMO-protein ligase pli1 [Eurotiomycetes sp. CCFEE 6388]
MRPLTQTLECKARETTRDTARLSVALPQQVIEQLEADSSCRVMVFCASEGFQPFSRESDISFPHNVELKCNQDEWKGNLRGLKNRPGSTKPADITHLIRKKPANYPNTVEMVYALTTKAKPIQKFYLVVNLVQQKSIDSLVSEIRRGRVISKEQVLREMRTKADDPDIVATSSVLSLKDPVAYTRIVTPCRSTGCNHNQCFDAGCFLQLQEQAPTWTCPICNKAAFWENLVMDQYVNDILNATPGDTEAVTVQPDGQWSIQKDAETTTNRNSNPTPSDDEDDDDDDLVEIGGERSEIRPKVETLTPNSVRTPPLSYRADSNAPSGIRSSTKRSREDVIDLTLSDDEGPAIKQPRLPAPSSVPSTSRPPDRFRFQLPPPNSSSPEYHRFDSNF